MYPTGGRPQVDLMMAVWTPGSYLIREYERHVEGVTARDANGRALAAVKPAKNRWRVDTGGATMVTVSYRVYGREMTVRTNWVEGAPTLFDADRAAADIRKIVEAGEAAMGPLEYPHDYFLNMVVETGGGLEDKNSFLTMSNRFVPRTRSPDINWLSLAAPEYFHN